MTKVEIAQTLGELIKMGWVEAVAQDGQPTRYQLTGRPGDDDEQEEEENNTPRRMPATVEAA